MKLRIPAVALIFLATLSSSAIGADTPEVKHILRYKFQTGEVVRYAVEHAANVRMSMKGSTQSTKAHSESTKAWKVLDVLPNGEIEFAHVVESIKMRNESPDRAPAEYDSEKDKVPPPGFEKAAAAIGVTLTVVRIKASGEIVSHKEKHAQTGNAEDAPMVVLLPEEAVAVGAEWNEPHHVNVKLPDDGQQRIETRRHFKLADVKNGVAKIEVSYQVISPINAPIEAQLVQKLSTGKVRFDIERGRILSQQLDVDKRIVGFAGPSSSMHFQSRFTERLLPKKQEVAKEGAEQIAK